MSERDELFQLMLGRTTTKAVERILAAGYRKPRTITTAEELDALPVGSVLLCRFGTAWRISSDVTDSTEIRYEGTSGNAYFTTKVFRDLSGPFTVIYEPEPQP